MTESEELSSRLAKNEANIETLTSDVRSLARTVDVLGQDFRQAIDALTAKFHENNKTPWGVLASWLALAVGIMSIIGAFYVRDLAKVEQDVDRNGMAIFNHVAESPTRREIELQAEILNLKIEQLQEKISGR